MPVAQRNRKRVRYKTFSERLSAVWNRRQLFSETELTQEWLAVEVSRLIKRRDDYSQGAISKWMSGTVPPVDVIQAIARIMSVPPKLVVDPGWLAYGPASQAPAPWDPILEGMEPNGEG